MRNFWVKGVLNQSLHDQVLISLDLEERPDAVTPPWNLMLGTNTQLPQELPANTSVLSLFDRIGEGRTLLILGEPGSGKTNTLLQLARDLIARAEEDVDHLIPVIFNLSSWTGMMAKAAKRKSRSAPSTQVTIADWLITELNGKYQVPKQVAMNWVKKQQLLLLLDGLDEVQQADRDDCVAALNTFQQTHNTEIVVCSRIEDYEALQHRLDFQTAIYLRSLTQDQIFRYLNTLEADLTGLRTLLETDPELQELAQSPLMLNLMVLSYQGIAAENLPRSGIVGNHRQHLFNSYIQRMLKRQGNNPQYSSEQTLHWLSWLSQRMQAASQTVFLIEQMQPSWLQERQERRSFYIKSIFLGWLVTGSISGLFLGGAFPLFLILWAILKEEGGLGEALLVGLLLLPMFMVLGLLFNGPLGGLVVGSSGGLKGALKGGTRYGILLGTLGGLAFGLVIGLGRGLISGLVYGVLLGLLLGLSSGFYGGIVVWLASSSSSKNKIEPAEKLSWSWQKAKRGLLIGIVIGPIMGIATVLGNGWPDGLFYAAAYSTAYGLGIALINGLIASKLEVKAIPNQGIRSSAKNFVTSGLILTFSIVLISGLISTSLAGVPNGPLSEIVQGNLLQKLFIGFGVGLYLGLIVGTQVGIISGLKFGGKACIQHFTLRRILHHKGYAPWNYARFLDYATDRLFLQKVGGGYIFIHRLLMEHFAQLNVQPNPAPVAAIPLEAPQVERHVNTLIDLPARQENAVASTIAPALPIHAHLACSTCEHQNSIGTNFCIRCGTCLIHTCSTCEYKNPANFNFCTKCGTRLI